MLQILPYLQRVLEKSDQRPGEHQLVQAVQEDQEKVSFSRLLRKLMDKENQEIQRRQMEEQKRLMNEASRRCQMESSVKNQRSFAEIIPEVEHIANKFAKNYIDQHPQISARIQQEEAKTKVQKPLRGSFVSIFSLSSSPRLLSSFLEFQLEEMFKVLVLPEQTLEEFFRKMDQSTLKKEFKKMALLLHPDKNEVPYSKIAFQKIFAVYERCKC